MTVEMRASTTLNVFDTDPEIYEAFLLVLEEQIGPDGSRWLVFENGRTQIVFFKRDEPAVEELAADLDCDMEAAKTAFLAQDVEGIGHSVKVRERIGGADRAIAVRNKTLEQRRLDS